MAPSPDLLIATLAPGADGATATGTVALLGPAAGLVASVLWTFTSILFTLAGRRIGPTLVNALRIALAIVVLAVIHRLASGTGAWIPEAQGRQVLLLAISGLIGLTIGDQALFTAFVDIGPRLANLVMTSAPIFAALLGWIVLGERLSPLAWTAMLVTVGGIAWVIRERPRRPGMPDPATSPHRTRGLVLAVVGGFCQAAGLMLSKAGMGHGWAEEAQRLDPQAATLIRMAFAGAGMVPLLLWRRARMGRPGAVLRERTGRRSSGFLFTALGTIVGPVLGVWMSLVAANATDVGIAQTLLSLTPLFILPWAAFVDREAVSRRAIAGAVIAVAGVAVLFTQA